MNQYYIMEIQQDQNGSYAHLATPVSDENETQARLKAESTYHTVLAAAAVSNLLSHSATLLTGDGRVVMNQCYRHEKPEETPQEEP